uniref:Uncharacterized protein n=1 Tax=Ixodes ricinus TaxID=34613 RepID=A0A147BMG1_IXORI
MTVLFYKVTLYTFLNGVLTICFLVNKVKIHILIVCRKRRNISYGFNQYVTLAFFLIAIFPFQIILAK